MSAFSSIAKSRLASLLAALGLALASYLALLKLYALPCLGPGSCQAVLHSQFGAVFRVPVGVLGALLWLAVILVPDRSKRGALLLLMSAGAAMFMVIQFVVLRGFCLYCTLHAVVTWAVLSRPARSQRNARKPSSRRPGPVSMRGSRGSDKRHPGVRFWFFPSTVPHASICWSS
jgi:uncharacterized membrane protein